MTAPVKIDPARCLELAGWAREVAQVRDEDVVAGADAEAKARTRENMAGIADHLTAAAELVEEVAISNTERDAARAECERLRAQLAETSKLLETECSLSTNTTNAMLKAQAERNSARGDQHATLARLHALLATEPAVSEERCVEIETLCDQAANRSGLPFDGDDGWVNLLRRCAKSMSSDVPSLLAAARQLHELRAGLQQIVGGEPRLTGPLPGPDLPLVGEPLRVDSADVERMGQRLADAALRALQSPATVVQPRSVPNGGPAIVDLVISDLRERAQHGQAKYGVRLQAHNGRVALVDAYQEALDLAQYLRQEIEEKRLASEGQP